LDLVVCCGGRLQLFKIILKLLVRKKFTSFAKFIGHIQGHVGELTEGAIATPNWCFTTAGADVH
jgi:hypothetical protein